MADVLKDAMEHASWDGVHVGWAIAMVEIIVEDEHVVVKVTKEDISVAKENTIMSTTI